MSIDYLSQPNDTYSEDVSTLAAGTILISRPCQVWWISCSVEAASAAILSFSDDSTGYVAADRKIKIAFTGPDTEYISFPHGLNCKKGLSVTSNLAGVDVFVSFD